LLGVLALEENGYVGHRLKILHWAAGQMMSEALAEMELTASQGHVLGYISHRESAPRALDIAEAFQLSGPTVSGILRRLESKGFIEFRTDQEDRRCKRIYALPKARAVHEWIEEAIRIHERRLVEGFTEEERQSFLSYLDRAIDNMGGGSCCVGEKEENVK